MSRINSLTHSHLVVLILFYRFVDGSVRLGYSRNPHSVLMCLFEGLVAVYYSLDLLLSKLSKALRSGKFRERHTLLFTQRTMNSLDHFLNHEKLKERS